jgi:hypothetical protein
VDKPDPEYVTAIDPTACPDKEDVKTGVFTDL